MKAPFQRRGRCRGAKNATASDRQTATHTDRQTDRLGFLDAFTAFAAQQLEIAGLARLCSETTNAIGALMPVTFTPAP